MVLPFQPPFEMPVIYMPILHAHSTCLSTLQAAGVKIETYKSAMESIQNSITMMLSVLDTVRTAWETTVSDHMDIILQKIHNLQSGGALNINVSKGANKFQQLQAIKQQGGSVIIELIKQLRGTTCTPASMTPPKQMPARLTGEEYSIV